MTTRNIGTRGAHRPVLKISGLTIFRAGGGGGWGWGFRVELAGLMVVDVVQVCGFVRILLLRWAQELKSIDVSISDFRI